MNRRINPRISRVRRVQRTYHNFRRTRQILTIFLKYGFGDILERIKVEYLFKITRKLRLRKAQKEIEKIHPAARLRMAFGELGPTFIKLGQILSTRPDLIPPTFVKELGKLRDEAQPLPFEIIETEIKKALGKSPNEIFLEFSEKPVASASISQVHQAKMFDGKIMAVKIQRPNIRQVVATDIEILHDLANLAERYLPEIALFNPIGIVKEFDKSIHKEMDFLREARNIERFAQNFRYENHLVVPQVYWSLTTETILTMDYIDGTKLSVLMEKETRAISQKVVEKSADIFLQQIFKHGFFHADPHPGNILLLPDETIAFLDFGMMGFLDDDLRDNLGELLYGIVNKDNELVLRSLNALATIPEDVPYRSLKLDLGDFIDRYHDLPISKVNFERLLNELLEIARQYFIKIPPDLVLMIRSLMISESIIRSLYPNFNFVERAKPLVRNLYINKFDPLKKMKQFLIFFEDLDELARSFPKELRSIMQKIKTGDMTVKFQHQNLEDLVTEMDLASNRLSFSLIIAAIIIGSSLIIFSNKGPMFLGFPLLGLIGFLIAGIFGLWLVINIIRSGKLR